jgi:dynein assembly factor with WDR repeat domains 1
MASGTCVHTLRGHNDEILDVSFNTTGTPHLHFVLPIVSASYCVLPILSSTYRAGSKLVTASADGNSRVYNTMTGACHAILTGHEGEISKVAFNPQGSRILTASSDKTARIWETETGDCLQVRF